MIVRPILSSFKCTQNEQPQDRNSRHSDHGSFVVRHSDHPGGSVPPSAKKSPYWWPGSLYGILGTISQSKVLSIISLSETLVTAAQIARAEGML